MTRRTATARLDLVHAVNVYLDRGTSLTNACSIEGTTPATYRKYAAEIDAREPASSLHAMQQAIDADEAEASDAANRAAEVAALDARVDAEWKAELAADAAFHERVAVGAYYLWLNGYAGSDEDRWFAAEALERVATTERVNREAWAAIAAERFGEALH